MQQNIHILFLDFDGVLHPDAVYLSRQGPTLKAEGTLFLWAPTLANLLYDFPTTSLVLSTSWGRHLGFKRALGYLPRELQERVIGATRHRLRWAKAGRMKTNGTERQDTTRSAATLPDHNFSTGLPLMTMYKDGQRDRRNISLPAHPTLDSAPPRPK